MDEILAENHGASQLLALLVVVLTMHLLFNIAKMLWSNRLEKDRLTSSSVDSLTEALQQNTLATQRLDQRIHDVETQLSEIPKFKIEIRKILLMLRELAGPRWGELREAANDGLD